MITVLDETDLQPPSKGHGNSEKSNLLDAPNNLAYPLIWDGLFHYYFIDNNYWTLPQLNWNVILHHEYTPHYWESTTIILCTWYPKKNKYKTKTNQVENLINISPLSNFQVAKAHNFCWVKKKMVNSKIPRALLFLW